MATVFSGLVSKLVVMVSPDLASKIGGFGFPDLGLKTGNYSLVIWASKSP
jgi:hypothetical protein